MLSQQRFDQINKLLYAWEQEGNGDVGVFALVDEVLNPVGSGLETLVNNGKLIEKIAGAIGASLQEIHRWYDKECKDFDESIDDRRAIYRKHKKE